MIYVIDELIYNNSLIGDINNDEVINILDVILLINFIIGTSEPSSNDIISSDLNQDGILNVLDIVILVNIILE